MMDEAVVKARDKVERRSRLNASVAALLQAREQVLVKYSLLAGVNELTDQDHHKINVQLHLLAPFLQLVVDYVAAGHFEIYQRIEEGLERREAVRAASHKHYPTILETTSFLVEFNDKYETLDDTEEDLLALKKDLPRLGQILYVRCQHEDSLLQAMR